MEQRTRRDFLKTTATGAAAAAVAGFPHVARAQTKLTFGVWDHWVPGANDVLKGIVMEWGKSNRVDISIDFITSIGNKLDLTSAAEYRAGSGHDIIAFGTWYGTLYKDKLETVSDVVESIQKQYGKYNDNAVYMNYQDGRWITVPAPIGSHTYPLETRMDIWKKSAGIDVQDIFPADVKKRDKKKIEAWDWKAFLAGAKKVHAAGFPFGASIAENTDSNDWLGPLFADHGVFPMDEKGNITIEQDATLQVIEYLRELTQYMPKEIYGWDDASNNRWLISGKGSAIINPPSAWTVAKRDQPQVAAQVWHHDMPRGPKGRWRGALPFSWGIWSWSKNKQAAKDLLLYLSLKEVQWKLITASQGYDYPQLPSFMTHPVWTEIVPPPGGQYNYPIRGDEKIITAGYPAKQEYGVQVYYKWLLPTMVGKVTSGGTTPKDAVKWAAKELESYKQRG
ncbi:MAG: extracellular solute-binding protein [Candidatus Rokubacteria bacterium]|nr:extracellular solute-binding protein [Candidatus Rokubacteria bacterium]